MKKILRLALTLFILFIQANIFANTVIVKGYVTDSANHAVVGKTVKIYSTDSSNNGCVLSHTVVTNPNGYYIDTLNCSGDIRKLFIIVESCNGINITHDPAVTGSNIVESNFVICAPTTTVPLTCKAAFSYVSVSGGVKFNSAGSAAVSGDSIISRIWNFGDSTAVASNNAVDPAHTYQKAGVYTVCLTIKTKKGCESSFCQTVVYTPASNDCRIEGATSFEKISDRKFRFNSGNISTLQGDSIVQRIWKFSDGSSLDGNQVNPLKEFKDTGAYNVCVSIRTAKGCEKQFCINVFVRDSVPPIQLPVNCKAMFSFSATGLTAKFNSNVSSAPAGDSITSRTWIFGDSTVLDGNRVDPSHTYTKAGSYTACLSIKTKKGCESKFCFDFTIRDTVAAPPTGCKAYFVYSIKDSTILFNSEGSKAASATDSIISRTWYYSDSSTSVSLGGNVVAPSYVYTIPGSYHVTLVIKTKAGCESKFVNTVVIPQPVVTTACKAVFHFKVQNAKASFSSADSKASSVQDSIISRTWFFGDNTTPLQGNTIEPVHQYGKTGKFIVYLYIKTRSGCESKYADTVEIHQLNCDVKAAFTTERISLKKVLFNSSLSAAAPGDSIIQRIWKFGDNTVLSGNELKPVKEFAIQGTYNTCLSVRTINGCEAQVCNHVTVQDTSNLPQTNTDYVKIMQINPNPVITRLAATIFSRTGNVEAEISVFDIYGVVKLTVKKTLLQGNNIIEIGTESLYHGPYFLKVSTRSGKDSKIFYKL
jgi:PKD repeat protein